MEIMTSVDYRISRCWLTLAGETKILLERDTEHRGRVLLTMTLVNTNDGCCHCFGSHWQENNDIRPRATLIKIPPPQVPLQAIDGMIDPSDVEVIPMPGSAFDWHIRVAISTLMDYGIL
jgi:hypothetical protein